MAFFKKLQKLFHDTRVELKKVHWPTRREFTVFTWIVLVAIISIGVFFYALDSAFTAALRAIIQ